MPYCRSWKSLLLYATFSNLGLTLGGSKVRVFEELSEREDEGVKLVSKPAEAAYFLEKCSARLTGCFCLIWDRHRETAWLALPLALVGKPRPFDGLVAEFEEVSRVPL